MRDPFLFEDDDFFSPVNTGGTSAALDDLEGYYDIDSPTSPTAGIAGVRPNLVYRRDTGRFYAPVTDPSASDDGEYVEVGGRLSQLTLDDVDSSPVGNILFKVIDQVLQLRTPADDAYLGLEALQAKLNTILPVSGSAITLGGAGHRVVLPNLTSETSLADRQFYRYQSGARTETRIVQEVAGVAIPRTIPVTTLLADYGDTTNYDSDDSITSGLDYFSMRWKPLWSDQVGVIMLYVCKQGNPTDGLRLYIYADDGTGKPNTASLLGISTTIQGEELTATHAMIAFQIPAPFAVTAATSYHIIPKRTGTVDAVNYYKVGVDASGPGYADGKVLLKIGDVWTEQAEDAIFEVWAPTAGGGTGGGGGAVTDELTKVSADDMTAGYLEDKVAAGTGISISTLNPAGDEDLQIAHATVGSGDLHTEYQKESLLTTLGDIIYATAASVWARLAGNTTTTKKFLTQTGDGAASAAPTWDTVQTIQDADGDTKIQTEESADEDKIRFDTGGVERGVLDSSGLTLIGTLASNILSMASGGTLTISSGSVTVTAGAHSINTEGGGASDDLDHIAGGAVGQLLILGVADIAHNVVLKHDVAPIANSLQLAGGKDKTMSATYDKVLLRFNGTVWYELASSLASVALQDHHARHENAGADEISLTGLVGDLRRLLIHISGGGSAIATGVKIHVPDMPACTVEAWTLVADQSGSIVLDFWTDTYANSPPTVADTMIATGTKPVLSSAQKNQDLTVDWAVITIAAGATLTVNVDSATTVTWVDVLLRLRMT
jgi:hypothetical protein